MKPHLNHLLTGLITLFLLCACNPTSVSPTDLPSQTPVTISAGNTSTYAVEMPVYVLPLDEPLDKKRAEISGMAWFQDYLVLLPQYPDRFKEDGVEALFAIPKSKVLEAINTEDPSPLELLRVPFYPDSLEKEITGFEGFEALTCAENQLFLTIESRSEEEVMVGYIIRGNIASDLSRVDLELETLTPIPSQTNLGNLSDETLILIEDILVTLHEANGANVNIAPIGHRFDLQLNPVPPVTLPHLEYRITDATSADENGIFWVINYFYPGDEQKLNPAPDSLRAQYPVGLTHSRSAGVERLVALQYQDSGIALVETHPIQLQLANDAESRNWEGIVRLDDRGFLMVTDEHPETILGFIPKP
ncbi:MAG: hypothetical protein JW981_00655 [Anaerolineae bacterium]|nr:hypothetical protein [Anaerolineae bacterium]